MLEKVYSQLFKASNRLFNIFVLLDAFNFYLKNDNIDLKSLQTLSLEVVRSYHSALTTTSPNSLLLASLDATRAQFSLPLRNSDSSGSNGTSSGEVVGDGRTMILEAIRAANSIRELIRSHYCRGRDGLWVIHPQLFTVHS